MNAKYIVKQHDIKDCGAASLLSIIKYYNGYVPMEKIREDTKITKEGITAYNLINAAKKYGFNSYGIKASINDILTNHIILPCIAYVELENGLRHFVVIYKITKKNLLIMDPGKGYVKKSIEEFNKIYQEVLIILSPRCEIIKYE